MDERIKHFIEGLRKELAGLPQEEIQEAVSYYEEYLSDAVAAGKDLDDLIKKLDTPEKIASAIKTESYIVKAQRNPGLRNFTSVSRNAFKSVTTPLSVFMLSIVVFISFCMVAVLFSGAFAFFTGAIILLLGLIYESLKIPSQFITDIIGTLGFGLLGAGICLLTAFGFFRIGKLFIRISTQMIRRMLLQSGKPIAEMEKQSVSRKIRPRIIMAACITMIVVGVLLSGISGLPVKYFTIFNSMKPENIKINTHEFQPDKIDKISVVTTNSIIRISEGTSDKIVLTYEQSDWLDYDLNDSGRMFVFKERSNNRLPLYSLASMHEGMTEVTISVPKGFTAESITLESNGGHIYITGISANIKAKTFSNKIDLKAGALLKDFNIKAFTWSGDIIVEGNKTGVKTNEGTEYYKNINAAKTIDLSSSNGTIHID